LEAGALLTMTALLAASMTALGFDEFFQKLVKSARVGQFARRFSPSPCGSPNRSYLASNGDVDASPRLRRWDDHEIARLRRMYARHPVRGRWHFWGCLPRNEPFPTVSLASSRLIGYTLAS
jgi:hypothetical protein